MTLDYARKTYADHDRLTETAGAIATATCMAAHAILAARGEWVTNEKRLLDRAGLREVDSLLTPDAVDRVTELLQHAVRTSATH